MSFSENLQILRKTNGISQEQLAERLDVSRQAVSKWETDGGYPEMDKIDRLCEIFGVTMDELIRGQVEVDKADIRRKYDKHYNSFAFGIATGVFLIIFGVSLSTLFAYLTKVSAVGQTVGTAIMFVMIAIAVALFIIYGSRNSSFERANPIIPEIYTPEEEARFGSKVLPFLIAGGIALIFAGICLSTLSAELNISWLNPEIANSASIAFVAAAVWMFTYGGIRAGKYNIKEYNRERDFEQGIKDTDPPEIVRQKKREALKHRICGVLMLSATAVYIVLGIIFGIWDPGWIVFPVSGIACMIISIVLSNK